MKMKTDKRNKLLFLLMFLLITLPLWQNAFATGRTEAVSIRVDGLSCPFCAYGLEKKLKRLEGAETIHIDIEKGVAHIQIREGQSIDEKNLKKAVEDAGFTAREIIYGPAQK